ncbi:CDP-diacylglycerol--glycerol-3-phosphate 3-phosphatidyltransferase, mitochondrial isoform X2 [Tribolium madens]|nr:CDP-diacylglycerol--glycerol-3-phosphate 3-phosphatidyltransferase, mitochondrial isoform X2 [Tribolium madens]XP_044253423.1 CDP-diacylglycerol--glycerol-3-phosphate 3-phosphatidyltransferase, mitochondrial isoform X2 [Tribolium madens]
MFRRVFNSLLETTAQTEIIYPNPFTKPETIPFGWLSSVAPCFPINASNIRVLSEPPQFYNVLKEGCASATRRIVLVSLYLGTGSLEKKLVKAVLDNENFQNGGLSVSVLLDYMRGSRFEVNSRTVLRPLLQKNSNCTVSLYHTPVLRGLLKRVTPDRWNELYGLQHMKLYIFDDTLVISGANLSNDYFTNRQDRYFVIKDKRLCDFYCGLVKKVQKFSLTLDKNNNVGLDEEWTHLPYEGRKNDFIEKAGDIIESYITETKNERNIHKEEGFDTWIFPLVQMGQLGITQDSETTTRLLSEAPQDSTLYISTGYFNLTTQYMTTLINQTTATCKILMAHPKANGFLGAEGPAGGIPYAYSLIAHKFRNEFEKLNQQHRIDLFEYLRDKWTYHGKGLWYYASRDSNPSLTLIGSPNFGERSVKRDLETQLAIVTENSVLKKELHEECQRLYGFGRPAETERAVPKWVHGFVFFFRNFF